MKYKNYNRQLFASLLSILLFAVSISAQTTVFTYQGKLTDNGTPQANYQMEFKLFGSTGGADQIGATVTNTNISVMNGVFTVNLDFGAPAFPGADRFLQISVRRSAGESFVTLNPRQQITSSPYSIRTLSAAQADVALDANKLGGVNASEYVTTSSVGNSFIKNATTQQIGNFNVSGNGTLGGGLLANSVTALTGANVYGLTHTDGTTTLSTFTTGSGGTGGAAGWFGTRTNHPLHFFTNNGQPRVTLEANGNLGVGTSFPQAKFHVANGAAWFQGDSALPAAAGKGVIVGFSSEQGYISAFDYTTLTPKNLLLNRGGGNVGIGTSTPNTRLTLSGGTPWTSGGWTASMNMQNATAFGWEANSSGQRFGIGQSNGGLYFFRTTSAFGSTASPPTYDFAIQDDGNLTQAINKNGLVKAMIYVDPFLPASQYIVRCYNGGTNSSTGNCGFSVTRLFQGSYRINFGFPINNRFLSLTSTNETVTMSATYGTMVNEAAVFSDTTDAAFFLIVY